MPVSPAPLDLSLNPLRAEGGMRRRAQNAVFVAIGATGDLMQRKLMPALYSLAAEGMLPAGFAIVGVARSPLTHDEFRARMREAADTNARRRPVDDTIWNTLAEGMYYQRVDEKDGAGWDGLGRLLAELDAGRHTEGNRAFYMAVPPGTFEGIVSSLHEHGLLEESGGGDRFIRVVIEKPFGRDLLTSQELNADLSRVLPERQVYRIDHYLGKETVQNIIALRFANRLFEPLWNQRYVESVQVMISETLGMEGRGSFFDEVGILRDIVANHGLQLLALIGMEPPISLDPDAVRDEKVKALRSVRRLRPAECAGLSVRGQFVEGHSGGQAVPAYTDEAGVAHDSRTETYAQLLLHLDNWRWAGVPFLVRAGKRMPKRITEIALTFRDVPQNLFQAAPAPPGQNVLSIRIQPDEGVSIMLNAKTPGTMLGMQPVLMDFDYSSAFGGEPPEAYERLIHDVLVGDQTLFTRRDEVEAEWDIVDPVLQAWEADRTSPLPTYAAGTWGPDAAAHAAEQAGLRLRRL